VPNGSPDSDSTSSDTEGMTGKTQDPQWYPDPFDLSGPERLRALKKGSRGVWLDDVRPLDKNYKPVTDVDLPKPSGFQTPDTYPAPPPQDAPAPPGTPTLPAKSKPRPSQEKPVEPGSQPKLNLSNLQTPTASSSDPRSTPPSTSPFNRPDPEPDPPTPKAEQSPLLFAKDASKPEPPQSAPQRPAPAPNTTPGFQLPDTSSDAGDGAGATTEEIAAAFNHQTPEPTATTLPERPTPVGRKLPMPRIPGRELLTWALTLVVALAVLVAPRLIPTATQDVHEDCKPISGVVLEYRDAASFEVTDEVHGDLAAAASSGELPDSLMELVTTAVGEDDMEPVLEYCLVEDAK